MAFLKSLPVGVSEELRHAFHLVHDLVHCFLVEFRMFLLHALPAAVSVKLLYALIFGDTFELLRTDCRFLICIEDVSRRWRHLQLLPHCLKPPTYLYDHKAPWLQQLTSTAVCRAPCLDPEKLFR